MEMNVYEYPIKDKHMGNYMGSYTVKAGSKNEKELQKKLKSKKIDSFEHIDRTLIAPKHELKVVYMTK